MRNAHVYYLKQFFLHQLKTQQIISNTCSTTFLLISFLMTFIICVKIFILFKHDAAFYTIFTALFF